MKRSIAENGPHPVDRHVGRRVVERRIGLGFNQSDLGKALGLTFQQIQKYEKGANRISASKLWDIARFLDVDISYFFAGLSEDLSAAPGMAESAAPAFATDWPVTRQSLEIAKLAPQLSLPQQKLALELVRELAGSDGQ